MIRTLNPQEVNDLPAFYRNGTLYVREDRPDLSKQFEGALSSYWLRFLIIGEEGGYRTYKFDDDYDYAEYEDGKLLQLMHTHGGLHAQAVAQIGWLGDGPHGGFRSIIQRGFGNWNGDFLIPISGHRALQFGWEDSWKEVLQALPDGHSVRVNYDPEFFVPQML